MRAVKSPSRRDQYSAATRAALLEAATRRFAAAGFKATSLEDIAADIQASRGAVYHHFTSKESLFEAVFEQVETAAIARITEAGEQRADPWASALDALDSFLDQCMDAVYGRIVWQEAPLALGWHRWHEREAEFAHGLIERLLQRLLDSGAIDPLPVATATRLLFTLLGAAGIGLADTTGEEQSRLRAEYSDVIRRMIGGLRAS